MDKSASCFQWNSEWDERYRTLSFENVVSSTEALTERNPAIGAGYRKIGKGYAVFHGPQAAMTAASGIGVGNSGHKEELAEVEDFYLSRGCAPRLWTNNTTHPELLRLVEERGYRPILRARMWIRPAKERVLLPTGDSIHVRTVDLNESESWIQTVGAGFQEEEEVFEGPLPKLISDMFYSLAFAEGFTAFLAFQEEMPVGGGVLAEGHGIAILRTASTRFRHRGKGVQRRLIAARLQQAREKGVEVCLATTSDEPTDASAKNMAAFGFRPLRVSALVERA